MSYPHLWTAAFGIYVPSVIVLACVIPDAVALPTPVLLATLTAVPFAAYTSVPFTECLLNPILISLIVRSGRLVSVWCPIFTWGFISFLCPEIAYTPTLFEEVTKSFPLEYPTIPCNATVPANHPILPSLVYVKVGEACPWDEPANVVLKNATLLLSPSISIWFKSILLPVPFTYPRLANIVFLLFPPSTGWPW